VTGIVLIMVLALVFDLILVGIGRLLLPWTRADRRAGRQSRRAAMRAVTGA
jgi:osmoprotectant transport system permease protein